MSASTALIGKVWYIGPDRSRELDVHHTTEVIVYQSRCGHYWGAVLSTTSRKIGCHLGAPMVEIHGGGSQDINKAHNVSQWNMLRELLITNRLGWPDFTYESLSIQLTIKEARAKRFTLAIKA